MNGQTCLRLGSLLGGGLCGLLALPASAHDTVYYYLTDSLHSAVVITDQNRNVVERTDYAAYGQVTRSLRDGPGYTGHEEDPGTGLVYMQQRYYDPKSRRFISADPVQPTANGGNFNRYWYAKDNPYRYTDPDGQRVLIPDERDRGRIQKWINSLSSRKFIIRKDGALVSGCVCAESSGKSYSYTKQLNAAIRSKKVITIKVGSSIMDNLSGEHVPLSHFGEGVTVGNPGYSLQRVIVSGKSYNGIKSIQPPLLPRTVPDDAAHVLAHELMGHAIPHIVGPDTGNAVMDENEVRLQNGDKLRPLDYFHTE